MARLSPGMLRHRVTIKTPGTTLDAYGQLTGAATVVAHAWASIEPLSGREMEQARAVSAQVTHRVHMWYCEEVNPKCQLVWGSKTLQIEAVIRPMEQTEELELLCQEKVAGASS